MELKREEIKKRYLKISNKENPILNFEDFYSQVPPSPLSATDASPVVIVSFIEGW
jgi:hypothetical protein